VIEPSLPYLFRRKIFITIGIEENPLWYLVPVSLVVDSKAIILSTLYFF
jgi:hypothetical protein